MKNILIVTDKHTGEMSAYTMVKNVLKDFFYLELNTNAIDHRISRLKQPYEDEYIKIQKVEINKGTYRNKKQ